METNPSRFNGQNVKTANSSRAHAFTLLELLIVISIIAILAALIFPALSRAKQKAQGIYCENNGQQMIKALHMYCTDSSDWLPPNPEDGDPRCWVAGNMTKPLEATNTIFLTDPQWSKLANYSSGSATMYKCPADKSTTTINDAKYPRVRTFSMNQSAGTKSDAPPSPVDGRWLDGKHRNQANNPWRTYGKFADMTAPSPSDLWLFIDEDEYSINDAAFGVSMTAPTVMRDWPGTYHNFACGLAFADGHSEIHKWQDGRTRVTGGHDGARNKKLRNQPNNHDLEWLQSHTSALAISQ